MDAQDIRNLQEAYLGVYDEAYKKLPTSRMRDQALGKVLNTRSGRNVDSKGNTINKRDRDGVITDIEQSKKMKGVKDTHSAEASQAKAAANKERGEKKKSTFGNRLMRSDRQGIRDDYQYDLYDIILSHLLDEGYAKTVESAEAIMVNMSEDWKSAIKKTAKGTLDVAGSAARGMVGKETTSTNPLSKVVNAAGRRASKSKTAKNIKRFATRTALGAVSGGLLSV
jgi:hypothetical protein